MLMVIPSMGRADKQRTLTALAPLAKVTLVVPYAEAKAYRTAEFAGEYPFTLRAPDVKGIGPTRQWILAYAASIGEDKVLMLDDDLEFFARRHDDATKLTKATPAQLRKMLALASKLLDKHVHIGVATREGANRNVAPLIYNTRLLRALGYRADILNKEGVRFDRIPVMEDFDVALQLLRLGYPSAQINSYTQDQPGSNTAGGCSTYRTAEVQACGANGLAGFHPDFVTVVQKEPLKSGGWDGQPRTDVRIAWKKAFDSYRGEKRVL